MKRYEKRAGRRLWIIFLVFGLLFVCLSQKKKTVLVSQTKVIVLPKIALTFDDGPHPVYTPKLLEGLRKRNVKCTFFVTGENASLYPELIEQMQKDGHLVGNHTYHHVQLSAVGEDIFLQELEETNRVLEEILGTEILFVRPPYGDWSKQIEQKINMFPVLWDVDPLDWCTGNVSKVRQTVLNNVEDDSIILMHDYYETSVEAALEIVDALIQEGYEFVTVDELLVE